MIKPYRDPLSILLLTTLLVCIVLILNLQLNPRAVAQVGCQNPPKSPFGIRESWPAAAEVSVNIDTTFTDADQLTAIRNGFENWNTARGTGGLVKTG